MLTIHYYSRRGCHLCEVMLEELLPLLRDRAEIELRDIDSNPEWLQKYDIRVPVVEVDGEVVSEYPLNYDGIHRSLLKLDENSPENSE